MSRTPALARSSTPSADGCLSCAKFLRIGRLLDCFLELSLKERIQSAANVSVVDGKPMRHATWRECESRVKGRSGARFKKAVSAGDEAAILRAWGFAPSDL